jgi:hypothetical protein
VFDLTKPVPLEVIFGSIGFILLLVGIGIVVVFYYKKKLKV